MRHKWIKCLLIIFTAATLSLLIAENADYVLVSCISLALLFSLQFSRLRYSHILSPVGLFSLGWLLPALIVFFYSQFYKIWQLETLTWFVILISWASFSFGALVVIECTKVRTHFQKITSPILIWNKAKFKKILHLLFLIGSLGLCLNTINIMNNGGFSLFSSGLRAIERSFLPGPINYLYFLNGLLFILASIYITVFGKNWLVLFYGFIGLISQFIIGIKTAVLFPLIICILAHLLMGYKIKLKYIFFFFLIFISTFIFVELGRLYPNKDNFAIEDLYWVAERVPVFVIPNYANLQQELLYRRVHTLGVLTLTQPLDLVSFLFTGKRLIKRLNPTKSVFGGVEWLLVKKGHNMGTFLRPLYVDFGFLGVILLPCFFGAIIGWFYVLYRSHRNITTLIYYSIMGMMALWAFWGFDLFEVRHLWYMFVVFIISRLINAKSQRNTKAIAI